MIEVAGEADDLSGRALDAFRRGDAARALALLAEAERAQPQNPALRHQKAMVRRAAGDLTGALEALDEALAIDPYDYVALLSKGHLLERLSGERAATPIYRAALKVAPSEQAMAPALAAPTERARAVVGRSLKGLEDYLRDRTAERATDCSAAARRRFDEAIGLCAGTRRAYVQEPLTLHYPRLPAIPFYEREQFPWLGELEAATEVIREELQGALAVAGDSFAPYIAYPPGAPLNQWEELNHSRRWTAFFLWKDGEAQAGAQALCPRTTAVLESLPMVAQPGFAPTAMFSALEPHAHIPPHTGATNVRLLCHLPLVLPGPARFRVGNETREWRMGEAWVFDDTIEHEAWNEADETRFILIFDIWNPLLEPAERDLVTTLLQARNDFFAIG
ncbi:aspartyl/asparaginyl beta-hydroxylase domain-containing protein [Phenylobacterium sp.]|uniref:aspartyl/asparaginyl beta-hydroxylase domain-containing protein n=1 Tax=Phenylobacterium sp. TaxID=1871053 RepID=UPI002C47A3E3|nr:aspartyl/asparaginyl beta-hydroxylase domain-containing protein [Phenylobacterium sp.]HVI31541.1 aspartyl/asparaginyl beta-hydroxylase domain-containing protein [Phenylobacterium sp.]